MVWHEADDPDHLRRHECAAPARFLREPGARQRHQHSRWRRVRPRRLAGSGREVATPGLRMLEGQGRPHRMGQGASRIRARLRLVPQGRRQSVPRLARQAGGFASLSILHVAAPNAHRVPGRHRLQADGLRQATASPQGLAVSGLSSQAGPHPRAAQGTCKGRWELPDIPVKQGALVSALDDWRITVEPYYAPQGDEVTLFEAAYRARLPVMVKGPTGCGKSRFIEYMAWKLGRPLVTVACNEDMTASDLVGRFLLEPGGTRWQDGPLTIAARPGAICYLDEIVEARQDTTVVIHPPSSIAAPYGRALAGSGDSGSGTKSPARNPVRGGLNGT